MSFRPATLFDAHLLYELRTEAEANEWCQGTPTTWETHLHWLASRISDPLTKILVWEENDEPAGVVRIDSNGELAFDSDDNEVALRMLEAALIYADEYGGRLKAVLDDGDELKIGLLLRAGFETYPAMFLAYKP